MFAIGAAGVGAAMWRKRRNANYHDEDYGDVDVDGDYAAGMAGLSSFSSYGGYNCSAGPFGMGGGMGGGMGTGIGGGMGGGSGRLGASGRTNWIGDLPHQMGGTGGMGSMPQHMGGMMHTGLANSRSGGFGGVPMRACDGVHDRGAMVGRDLGGYGNGGRGGGGGMDFSELEAVMERFLWQSYPPHLQSTLFHAERLAPLRKQAEQARKPPCNCVDPTLP